MWGSVCVYECVIVCMSMCVFDVEDDNSRKEEIRGNRTWCQSDIKYVAPLFLPRLAGCLPASGMHCSWVSPPQSRSESLEEFCFLSLSLCLCLSLADYTPPPLSPREKHTLPVTPSVTLSPHPFLLCWQSRYLLLFQVRVFTASCSLWLHFLVLSPCFVSDKRTKKKKKKSQ